MGENKKKAAKKKVVELYFELKRALTDRDKGTVDEVFEDCKAQVRSDPDYSTLAWEKGHPFSHYVLIALRDLKIAMATGDYELDGGAWHLPGRSPGDAVCHLCVAGGAMAGRFKFDPTRTVANYDVTLEGVREGRWKQWEIRVFISLEAYRMGSVYTALSTFSTIESLHGPPIADLPPDGLARKLVDRVSDDIKDHFDQYTLMSPIHVYERGALMLATIGL